MTYDHLIGAGFERWNSGTYTPGQLDFMGDTQSPSILYTGAYRAGKSEIASRGAIRHCLAFERAKFGVFRAKLKSLRQSTLKTVLELVHPSWVEAWSNSELELRLFNGSTLTFYGCDFADRIGSIELSGAFIDEAHEVSTEAYGMIVGRMSAPLQYNPEYLELFPHYKEYAESSVNSRQVYLACNPKGRNHWLYTDFIDKETRLPGRSVYSSNTITNKNLPDSYLRQNLNQYARPGVSEEELGSAIDAIRGGNAPSDGLHLVPKLTPFGQRNLLGLWVALEGAIFEVDRKTQTVQSIPDDWGEPVRWYAAADFGFHHPRLLLASFHEKGRLLVQGYWSDSSVDQTPLLDRLETWNELVNIDSVFLPPDQPGIIQQARQRLGASKVVKANNKVLPGISSAQVAINRGLVKFGGSKLGGSNIPHASQSFDLFWGELEGYSWKRGKEGEWLDEPLKENDHFPDALRYMVHTLTTLKKLELHPKQEKTPDRWGGLSESILNSY